MNFNPHGYQADAIAAILNKKRVALWLEMG